MNLFDRAISDFVKLLKMEPSSPADHAEYCDVGLLVQAEKYEEVIKGENVDKMYKKLT